MSRLSHGLRRRAAAATALSRVAATGMRTTIRTAASATIAIAPNIHPPTSFQFNSQAKNHPRAAHTQLPGGRAEARA